jgi:hypothetical protein
MCQSINLFAHVHALSFVAQVHGIQKLFFKSSGTCIDQVLNLSKVRDRHQTSRQLDLCLISGGGDLFH